VWNLHAAEDEPAPGDQLMNVIADANVNHGRTIKFSEAESEEKWKNSHGTSVDDAAPMGLKFFWRWRGYKYAAPMALKQNRRYGCLRE
jgi:hypothetical protein